MALGASVAPYRDQTVEVALGAKGAFETANVGAVTRRVATAVPHPRRAPRPPRKPRPQRAVELLQKAAEWRRQLDVGEIENQAAIARREGITRARVTQILGMLRLTPRIQRHILSMPEAAPRSLVTERDLRSIIRMPPTKQGAHFHALIG